MTPRDPHKSREKMTCVLLT